MAIFLVMMLIFTPTLTQALAGEEDNEIGSDIRTTTEDFASDQTSPISEHQESSDSENRPSTPAEEQEEDSEEHQDSMEPPSSEESTMPDESEEPTEEPEPQEPVEPDHPVEPEDPQDPSETEDPVVLDEPGEPTEEPEPQEPVEPEHPVEPEDPQDPSETEDPVVPDEPGEPSEEPEPQEPVEPEYPENPQEPINPGDIPIEPITPAEPLPDVPVPEGNPSMSITIDTDKDVYYLGETIEYDVIVINTGDVDLEDVTAYVYSSVDTTDELVGFLAQGQKSRFSGKILINSDFTESLLEINVTAKGWFEETRIKTSATCQVLIEANPFIELKMPPGMDSMAHLDMFRSLERAEVLDYGPPKSVTLPEPVKSSGTQDTIGVNKTAEPSDVCRTYDVKLQITGEPAAAPVDVVLVIDRSGSMDDVVDWIWGFPPIPIRVMDYAKYAAKEFADKVLADGDNRIAVVSFSGPQYIGDRGKSTDAKQHIGLSNNVNSVKNAINNISTYYGTNIEAGFIMARDILLSTGRPNANKVIVLLTDGVANSSIGNPSGPNEPTWHNAHTIAAYEAGQSCWNMATVFTVGLLDRVPSGSKQIARETLQWAQNAGYYEAEGAPDLSEIYDEISGKLGYSALNAVVEDVIDENFELIEDSLTPNPSVPVTYDPDTRTITWRPGTITNLATLTYKVRAKAGVKGNNLPTNDSAILRYTDVNGTSKEQTFPVPTVNVIGVDAGPDLVIVVGDSIDIGQNLQVYGYEPFQYLWTNDTDTGWSSNEPNPAIQPEEDTVYTIQITDKNGCKASDSISVTVKKGKILINKNVLPGVGGTVDTGKGFVVHVDGPHGKQWNTFIKHNETKQIGNLWPGDYEITEIVPMDYKLVSIINSNFKITREMILEDTVVTVTVTNKKVNDSWFRDDPELDNYFTMKMEFKKDDFEQREEKKGLSNGLESLEAVLPGKENDSETVEESSE